MCNHMHVREQPEKVSHGRQCSLPVGVVNRRNCFDLIWAKVLCRVVVIYLYMYCNLNRGSISEENLIIILWNL